MKYLVWSLIISFSVVNYSYAETQEKQENTDKKEEKKVEKTLQQKLATSNKKNIGIYGFNPQKESSLTDVVIIEFNDLKCQECLQKAEEFYQSISEDNLDKVKLVYKHIASTPNSLIDKQAIYGLLSSEYGKFWEFRKKVLEKNPQEDDELLDIIFSLGIDNDDAFEKIFKKGNRYYSYLDVDNKSSDDIRNVSVPMFFVDGYRVDEDISLQDAIEYINLNIQKTEQKAKEEQEKYNIGKI